MSAPDAAWADAKLSLRLLTTAMGMAAKNKGGARIVLDFAEKLQKKLMEIAR